MKAVFRVSVIFPNGSSSLAKISDSALENKRFILMKIRIVSCFLHDLYVVKSHLWSHKRDGAPTQQY